jgi:hypothetical protein
MKLHPLSILVGVILAGAMLVAASNLLTNHWQILSTNSGSLEGGIVKLNRWTGTVTVCGVDRFAIIATKTTVGSELICGQ